jgi:Amt family ammonium transporter
MDIRMPVMDGMEAIRRIKKTENSRSTIVAALTAHALAGEKEQILAAGYDDLVCKPFFEREIFEAMARHLDLEYVYEDEPAAPDVMAETEVQITSQQLRSLPGEMGSKLHKAAMELDERQILELIEQVSMYDANTAAMLKAIVNRLEFHRLEELLQAGKAKNGGRQ